MLISNHHPMSPPTHSLVEEVAKNAVKQEIERRATSSDLEFLPKFSTVKEVLEFAKKQGVTMLDLTFTDVPGTLQHTSCPVRLLNEDTIEEGFGFDGSSIRGFQEIQESDMLLMPDITTAYLDTFSAEPTISVLCNVKDPISGNIYASSPRSIALRAVEHLKSTGIADTVCMGPELEFFIFDHVEYSQSPGAGSYAVDSVEAIWNTGMREDGGNKGYKIRHKEGYFPGPPMDQHQDVRTAMVRELERAGIEIESFHHEVATAGQAEIDMRFDDLLSMADKVMRYKYIVRNVAARYGKTATFMAKPIHNDNGSGMHVHQSLWMNGETLFAGDEYAGLSETALHYIGGILKHAKALTAFTNPTTNSYRRLVPGFEAPVNFIYSARNRSAAIRIPMYSQSPKSKRVEIRFPDATANPYLAFSAMLLAGLDGVRNKIDPGEATDKNLYSLSDAELEKIPHAPTSLENALLALEKDHVFLTETNVFDEGFISTYIAFKRSEIAEGNTFPTPWEFYRYFDV